MTMTVQSSLIQVLINRETPFNSFRCKQTILFDIKGPASDDVSNIFSTDLLEVKKMKTCTVTEACSTEV